MTVARSALVLARTRHEGSIKTLKSLADKDQALEMLSAYPEDTVWRALSPYCEDRTRMPGFCDGNPHLALAMVRSEVHGMNPQKTRTGLLHRLLGR